MQGAVGWLNRRVLPGAHRAERESVPFCHPGGHGTATLGLLAVSVCFAIGYALANV
jgi:hypothetical protein